MTPMRSPRPMRAATMSHVVCMNWYSPAAPDDELIADGLPLDSRNTTHLKNSVSSGLIVYDGIGGPPLGGYFVDSTNGFTGLVAGIVDAGMVVSVVELDRTDDDDDDEDDRLTTGPSTLRTSVRSSMPASEPERSIRPSRSAASERSSTAVVIDVGVCAPSVAVVVAPAPQAAAIPTTITSPSRDAPHRRVWSGLRRCRTGG